MIVALYARVSTTKQAEKDLSIPDQLRQMRDWCKANKHAVATEYIEPGASATDDRRPVFQQMIMEACASPSPYSGIIVHSLSRFFRDAIELGMYERRLKKVGVVLISITQQTSDDPAGEMVRRVISLFDEYQSKENSKHTLRAMKENARQGFFNGSTPPYGYRKIELPAIGNKGKKKKLEIDPAEAAIVRKIFALYLEGDTGKVLGMKGIASYLNEHGITMRGKRWERTIINDILASRTYIGEYYFNKRESKTRKQKPESEWVLQNVEPTIDKDTFERTAQLRKEHSPSRTPPRIVNSPTLLTGLLKCGCCGAPMTLATGKGGKHRYYKCTSRINRGPASCTNRNIPMEKLDNKILEVVSEKVFIPKRVEAMLKELQAKIKGSRTLQDDKLKGLTKELETLKQQTERLYEAVEKGLLPMDESLKERVHKLHARRQELLIEIASLRRQSEMPLLKLQPKHISAFCTALKKKLIDKTSRFGKEYLNLLVEEIRLEGDKALIIGSYSALAGAVAGKNLGTPFGVPRFGVNWLPIVDSFRNFFASESFQPYLIQSFPLH